MAGEREGNIGLVLALLSFVVGTMSLSYLDQIIPLGLTMLVLDGFAIFYGARARRAPQATDAAKFRGTVAVILGLAGIGTMGAFIILVGGAIAGVGA
jgi:hypothetical protein